MRISDWSSDVFSSDLEQFIALNDDRIGRIEDDRIGRAFPSFCCLVDLLLLDEQIFKPAGLHEVAKDVDVPIGNGRVEPFIGIGAIGEVEELVAKLRRGLARSEEHTSELQSLMRTSYAVFCLQKK